MTPEYRKRVVVSGRVQGVGFRYYTVRLAQDYPVTGYVMNLPNNEVEIVAEGEKEAVEAFLEKASRGPGHAMIFDVRSFMESPSGGYKGFGIKYDWLDDRF